MSNVGMEWWQDGKVLGWRPDTIYQLANELLQAAVVEFARVLDPHLLPEHAAVWPSRPDTEKCCEGELYVYLMNIGPSYSAFPTQDFTSMRPCAPPTAAVDLIVGVSQCTPIGERRPPSDEEIDKSGLLAMTQAWALWRAAMCKGMEWVERGYSVGPNILTPLDDTGGCVNFEQRMTVGLQTLCANPPC